MDKIIAITPWELGKLCKLTKSKKISVIPNGVDSILFNKVKENNFRKFFGDNKIVLFFGRLNETKCPDNFVLAAKEILKEREDIEFVVIGPDEGMKAKVKELIGTEDRIYLFDAIRDKEKIAEMYQGSDVYVLPSYREGLPLTIFEAMACGLPIVASAVNGIPYAIKDGVNGFLVKHGDIFGLRSAILKVLDDSKLAKEMGENNLEKAKRYTWDNIAKETMEVYQNA